MHNARLNYQTERKADHCICSCYTQTQADGATVSLQLFDAGELHDRGTDILETLLCEVRAGDVLDV